MAAVLAFVPEEALILVLVMLGLLVVLGVLKASRAVALLGALAAFSFLSPVAEAGLDLLPLWAVVLLLSWLGYALGRSLAGFFLGKEVADHLIANLLSFVLIAPLRLAARLLSNLFRRV